MRSSRTRTYRIWHHMIERCLDPKHPQYHNYGGRGIKVCDRWRDFNIFLEDMGEHPLGFTLDRINNNGDYEPTNCRWTNYKTQLRNTRRNLYLSWKENSYLQCEWAEITGLKVTTIRSRRKANWPIEDILTISPIEKIGHASLYRNKKEKIKASKTNSIKELESKIEKWKETKNAC